MCDWTREAPLAELLDDPVAVLVMRSDGVDPSSVERLLATIDCARHRPTTGAARPSDAGPC